MRGFAYYVKINVEFSLEPFPSINDDPFGMVPFIHARSCSIGSAIDSEIDGFYCILCIKVRDLNSINVEAVKP